MANFDTTRAKITSVTNAAILVQTIQATYRDAKTAQGLLNLYTAGSDTVFNSAVNALFTSGERSELGQMLTQLNSLISDWEANHAAVLGV